jgi:peptide/nickel transport system substrate-binding protein
VSRTTRIVQLTLLVAALGLLVAACGGSSNSSGSAGTTSGKPVRGGTLYMLGTGDVDYVDPNVSYYPTGFIPLRLWARQLLNYPAIAGQTTQAVPDLATQVPTVANGGISRDGLTYKLTIRTGAMWNSSPPRQVTAADVVRGLKRACNPVTPFGGLSDFRTLIAGYQAFCASFAKVPGNVAAIKSYIDSHNISGLSVDPSNPQTVIFTLTHPATYFVNMLAMPVFSPAPAEFLNYLPASAALAQHTVSDGPYQIKSYIPVQKFVFVRNPAWRASSDPIRKAYVNQIIITETGNQASIQQQIETNSAPDVGFNQSVPTASLPALIASKNPNLTLGPTFYTQPSIFFNEASPNNHGALANKTVRQALEYAINRTYLVQDEGGPSVSPPITQPLPPGILGSHPMNMYPYDPQKAKQMLASVVPDGHLTLKLLYQSDVDYNVKMFQTLQANLATVGVTVAPVGVPSTDYTSKYLSVPSVAKRGGWDMALAIEGPDWYGNAALSMLAPVFGGSAAFPPNGIDYWFYNDPVTNRLIQEATVAPNLAQSTALWAEADTQVMKDAAVFPIASPLMANFHSTEVHNAVYLPVILQYDPANVWVSH